MKKKLLSLLSVCFLLGACAIPGFGETSESSSTSSLSLPGGGGGGATTESSSSSSNGGIPTYSSEEDNGNGNNNNNYSNNTSTSEGGSSQGGSSQGSGSSQGGGSQGSGSGQSGQQGGSSGQGSSGSSQGESDQGGSSQGGSSGQSDPITPPEDEYDTWDIKSPKPNKYSVRSNINEVERSDLFNLNNRISIEIKVSNDELAKLDADRGEYGDNKSEIYRRADSVTIIMENGDNTFTWKYEDVGIRQKGGVYSRNQILYGDGVNTENHFKLKFNETFDGDEYLENEYVAHPENEKRDLLGMDALDIKFNRNNDLTYIREIYASRFFRANGIMYQRVGLSNVSLLNKPYYSDDYNDNSLGLCTIYEPASKEMVKDALKGSQEFVNMPDWDVEKKGTYGVEGSKYGDLYKATYGKKASYIYGPDLSLDSLADNGIQAAVGPKDDETGSRYPIYERKTNKSEDYDDAQLRHLINVLNNGSYSDISEVVDLEYLAKEEAVAFFVGNPDSFRYNNNNYQMYFRRTDGKMIIIPIDSDRAFGTGETWPAGLSFVTNSTMTPTSTETIHGRGNNPLIAKTILSDTDCQKLFLEHIERLTHSDWLDPATFEAYYNVAASTYGDDAYFALQNGDNISFSSYIYKKLVAVGAGNDDQLDSEFFGQYVDSLYLAGDFNNWGEGLTESEWNQYKLYLNKGNTDEYMISINVYPSDMHFSSEYGTRICGFKISGGPDGWADVNYGYGYYDDHYSYLSFNGDDLLFGDNSSSVDYYTLTTYVNIHNGAFYCIIQGHASAADPEPSQNENPEPITYTLLDYPEWVVSDDCVLFAWAWSSSDGGQWYEVVISNQTSISFEAPMEMEGFLIVRCVEGTTTPDWSIQEGAEPGRIYNQTINYSGDQHYYIFGDYDWIPYPNNYMG